MVWQRKSVSHLRVWAAVVLAFFSGAPAGFSIDRENRQAATAQHAAQAAAATQQGDFGRAEEEWKKVIALDPLSAQAFHNLGLVYYLQRKYPEAEESLARALRINPSLANARVLLGASLARQGKLERSTTELERSLKTRLSRAAEKTARMTLHEVWFAREKYERALKVLKPLEAKYPQDVDVLYSLGQTYLRLSGATFQNIVLLDPDSYRVHQILGESLAKQGLYSDAVREYRQALEKKPDLPGIHYQLGLLYWLNEATEEGQSAALKEFERELKINPYDASSEYRRGQIYWKRRDVENAAAHFRRALQLDESFVSARLGLAQVLEAQANLEEAQKHLEVAAKLAPENGAVHYRLARLHRRRGNEAAAAEELKKFEEIRAGRRGAFRELEKALRQVAEPESEDVGEQDP